MIHKSQQTLKKFICTTFFFAFLDISFVEMFFVPMFQSYGMLPFALATMLVVRKITRMLTDIPLAILVDKYGAKKVFLLARICRISSVILLFLENKICLIISMILYGISLSGFYGKIDSYIYNYLKLHNKSHFFPRIMSIYYTICQIGIIVAGIVASYIFASGGYNAVLISTIITTTLSILPWKMLYDVQWIQKKHQGSIATVKIAVRNLQNNRKLMSIIVLLAIMHMLAWQSGGFMQPAILAAGMPSSMLSLTFSIKALCMSLGSGAAFFVTKHLVKTIFASWLFFYTTVLMVISAIFFNYYAVMLWLACYALIFSTIQIIVEQELESRSDNSIRNTMTSFATFMSALFGIFFVFIFGFISQLMSPQIAFFIIAVIIQAIATWALIKLRKEHAQSAKI